MASYASTTIVPDLGFTRQPHIPDSRLQRTLAASAKNGIRRELRGGTLFDTAPLDENHKIATRNLERGLRLFLLPRTLGRVNRNRDRGAGRTQS